MHTNDTVAELVSLLRAHGISVPGESEAASDTASSTPAVPAAGTAIAEAPAAEIGFVRCTNCHAQLALYAADTAANVAPAVPANVAPAVPANVAPAMPANVAPAAANVAPAVPANVAPAAADVAPAAANVPPAPAPANIAPMSSRRSLSPRWYSVTAARQVGVMYAVWDPVVKDLVNGVHDWRAVKFSTEGEARHHYNEEQAAGRIRIHTQ
ncbi:hypothetical protein EYR38_009868 [Pleurotus pulmonarius]|nr:hypothetical protein EYR38_009868 [Pleurotus pulmonarius]